MWWLDTTRSATAGSRSTVPKRNFCLHMLCLTTFYFRSQHLRLHFSLFWLLCNIWRIRFKCHSSEWNAIVRAPCTQCPENGELLPGFGNHREWNLNTNKFIRWLIFPYTVPFGFIMTILSQNWWYFGYSLFISFFVTLCHNKMGQIWVFRPFLRTRGKNVMAWHLACWGILTTWRSD